MFHAKNAEKKALRTLCTSLRTLREMVVRGSLKTLKMENCPKCKSTNFRKDGRVKQRYFCNGTSCLKTQ